jgi:Tol biopolymer transport system component
MAFIQTGGAGVAVYVLALTSGLVPEGTPHRVTPDVSFIRTVAWTPDGRGLVFSPAGHMGVSRLHTVALASNRLEPAGPPELLPFGENADAFSLSRTGRLVYSEYLRDTNLWRLPLAEPDALKAVPLASSTYDEHTPDYSPNGERLAFTSTRTGVEEIWVANADGSHPVQMTETGGPVCANPRWSPDGQKILFHSSGAESTRELYVLHTKTRIIEPLTDDPAKDFQGSWSGDGNTVYFLSDKTGRDEIWKMPAAGGPRTQVTTQGGAMAIESSDRRFLYYAKNLRSQHAIWRVSVNGGEEKQVVEGLNNPLSFAVSEEGLYFSVSPTARATSIDFFEFKTGDRRTIVTLDKASWIGLALSPDKQYLVYSVLDSMSRNLMLVDKFQ